MSRCHPLLPDAKGPLGRMGSLTPGGSTGSGNASPRLPSWSCPGSCGHQLSPPFEHSRQMLPRLLRRWARKQHAAFKVPQLGRAKPPSPPCPETPTLRALLRRRHQPPAPPFPPHPTGTRPRSSFPGLGCARTEQLIYHPVPPRPCGCCLQQRSWEGEKISQVGLGKNWKHMPWRQTRPPGRAGIKASLAQDFPPRLPPASSPPARAGVPQPPQGWGW